MSFKSTKRNEKVNEMKEKKEEIKFCLKKSLFSYYNEQ